MQIYKAADGTLLKEMKLTSEPIFDGMIAAEGKLFICNKDRTLVCYE